MTQCQQTLLENVMLCGIQSSIILHNRIAHGPLNYEPEIFFCFPESEEQQVATLKMVFPDNLKTYEEKPQEIPVEKFLLMDQKGDTVYLYKQVFYEQLSIKNLIDSNDIKSVNTSHKGTVYKAGEDAEQSSVSDLKEKYLDSVSKACDRIEDSSFLDPKKIYEAVTSQKRKISGAYVDDMMIGGSTSGRGKLPIAGQTFRQIADTEEGDLLQKIIAIIFSLFIF